MEYKDYYKMLGVNPTADAKEIKKEYRRLARQYHPDVNPGDKAAEARFKEINEAYEVLSDQEKRRKYDELRQNYQHWQRIGGQPGGFDWGPWTVGGQPGGVRVEYGDPSAISGQALEDLLGGTGFSDFFESIFGSMGAGRARGGTTTAARGRDLEQPIDVTLEEAFNGAQRLMEIDGGTSSLEGRRLEVKIPPGVKTGSRIRVAGEGAAGGRGTPRGDLYLRINVLPHPIFERRDDDLHCEAQVDLFTALLGGEARVPTLSGMVALRIPPGTQSGRTFRLAGQGMPHLPHKGASPRAPKERGDLYAKVRVMLPENLSEPEKELVRKWVHLRNVASGASSAERPL
jgi:curved DNA-binding protein